MGHVRFSLRSFYDSASELVGIKSGFLLNRFEISDFLLEKYDDDFLKTDDLDMSIRLGSDVITDMVIQLRRRLGNLPLQSPTRKDFDVLREYLYKSKDIELMTLPSVGYAYLHENPNITQEELTLKLIASEEIDERLAIAIANISLEKYDTNIMLTEGTDWDGMTSLEKLFNEEVKPKKESDFIEQKFIDYLAANGHEIELVHWRNFERFCAEYFKRLGYVVQLGPGRNDGGIDIRIFKEQDDSSPLILVQCKRYKEARKVAIETIKAFYADILFEGAREGLIATSGYISSGGKKVCNARKYDISFAEKNNVSKWADSMWTHK